MNPFVAMGNRPDHVSPRNVPGLALLDAADWVQFAAEQLLNWESPLPEPPINYIAGGSALEELADGVLDILSFLPGPVGVATTAAGLSNSLGSGGRETLDEAAYRELNERMVDVILRQAAWAEQFVPNALQAAGMTQTCFRAGTPILEQYGEKAIEHLQPNDLVWAIDENDPNGKLALKRVLEVFRRTALVMNLHVRGQIIGTTAAHRFYVFSKGWIEADLLEPGDCFWSRDGAWVMLDDVCRTGELEAVYNVEVEDYHTYFVGARDWGFSVWAHNGAYDKPLKGAGKALGLVDDAAEAAGKAGTKLAGKSGAWIGSRATAAASKVKVVQEIVKKRLARGPGKLTRVAESFSDVASRYQKQVTGNPRGVAYLVDGVSFDGYRAGVLLEAKGLGYAGLIKDPRVAFSLSKTILGQARRQLRVAKGVPIQWTAAEKSFARGLRSLFRDNGVNIRVTHQPIIF